MTIEAFKQKISRSLLNVKLELVINENRSTMLSVLHRQKDFVRLSMHKMFLDAPESVILAIADYVRGTKRKNQKKDLLIRGYIQSNLERFIHSYVVDKAKLVTEGKLYDLAKIYEKLNQTYFEGKLNLHITWFGKSLGKRGSKIIFGQYFDHLKLIKIHRMLDSAFFPSYFVEFIVYHEMLHAVVPGFVDERGFFRIHGQEFKRREKEFVEYKRAVAWEKENKKTLFR